MVYHQSKEMTECEQKLLSPAEYSQVMPLWESLSFIQNSSPEPSWTLKSCGLSIALLLLLMLPHNFGSIECVTQAPHGRIYSFQLTKNILKQFFSFYSLLGMPSHLLFKSVFLRGMRYVIMYFWDVCWTSKGN